MTVEHPGQVVAGMRRRRRAIGRYERYVEPIEPKGRLVAVVLVLVLVLVLVPAWVRSPISSVKNFDTEALLSFVA
jgi:hypothetical protein